jgi:hypothetical protein
LGVGDPSRAMRANLRLGCTAAVHHCIEFAAVRRQGDRN